MVKTVIVKVESLDVQWSSNKLNFLTKYPTKIIINKTATWIKILLKFIKCPPIYTLYTNYIIKSNDYKI